MKLSRPFAYLLNGKRFLILTNCFPISTSIASLPNLPSQKKKKKSSSQRKKFACYERGKKEFSSWSDVHPGFQTNINRMQLCVHCFHVEPRRDFCWFSVHHKSQHSNQAPKSFMQQIELCASRNCNSNCKDDGFGVWFQFCLCDFSFVRSISKVKSFSFSRKKLFVLHELLFESVELIFKNLLKRGVEPISSRISAIFLWSCKRN